MGVVETVELLETFAAMKLILARPVGVPVGPVGGEIGPESGQMLAILFNFSLKNFRQLLADIFDMAELLETKLGLHPS